MDLLLDHPRFADAFAALAKVSLNPRRHLEQDARTHCLAVADAAAALAAQNGCSEDERMLLRNLALAHDIGKLGGSAKPSESVLYLESLGVEDPRLLTYVKWHDSNLPWWTAHTRGQAPSDKAWRRLAGKLDMRLLCLFFVADRIDAPGGWRRNAPARWFIDEARGRGLIGELALDLPNRPSERSAGAVWVHDGRALLIRVRATHYELPKGGVEFDELPHEAALRELQEEAGAPPGLHTGERLGELEYRCHAHLKRVSYYRVHGDTTALAPLPASTRERLWVSAEQLASLPLVNAELGELVRRALASSSRPMTQAAGTKAP